jgi:hypothetical protein
VLGVKLDGLSLRIREIGNVMTMDEQELTSLNHEAAKAVHYWLCLDLSIAEHNVGAPAAVQLGRVRCCHRSDVLQLHHIVRHLCSNQLVYEWFSGACRIDWVLI